MPGDVLAIRRGMEDPMENGKTDLRVRYTKEILRGSLLELMKTNPINRITITDICRKADINRGTFYKHYADPFDLLRQIQNELEDVIRRAVEKGAPDKTAGADSVLSVITEIFGVIAENGDLCRVLLGENGDKDFLRKIMYLAHDRTITDWKTRYRISDTQDIHFVYTFVVNGSVGVIQDWIDGGLVRPPGEMAALVETITNRVIEGAVKKQQGRRS